MMACEDGGSSPDLILRVFYKGGGLADFDALTFERLKYYEGIEGDLCAFNDVTGEIWVAKGDKVFKYDKEGRYEFGGINLRADATDIVVNENTGNGWVFCENGYVSQISNEGDPNNRPYTTYPTPYQHRNNTAYYLEPDNAEGGCWVIAKREIVYISSYGSGGLIKTFDNPVTAASSANREPSCWIATEGWGGYTELIKIDYKGGVEREITKRPYLDETIRLEFSEARNRLWAIVKCERNGNINYDIRVVSTNGDIEGIASNVMDTPDLVINTKRNYGWCYKNSAVAVFELNEKRDDLHDRFLMLGYGSTNREAENVSIIEARNQ
jgi:hypothetical protein